MFSSRTAFLIHTSWPTHLDRCTYHIDSRAPSSRCEVFHKWCTPIAGWFPYQNDQPWGCLRVPPLTDNPMLIRAKYDTFQWMRSTIFPKGPMLLERILYHYRMIKKNHMITVPRPNHYLRSHVPTITCHLQSEVTPWAILLVRELEVQMTGKQNNRSIDSYIIDQQFLWEQIAGHCCLFLVMLDPINTLSLLKIIQILFNLPTF